MSMYNLTNGFNPACILVMPMLGRKQDEWPRFRDCFVTDDKNIAIYPNATARLIACRAILSMLGDDNQTPTQVEFFPDSAKRKWSERLYG